MLILLSDRAALSKARGWQGCWYTGVVRSVISVTVALYLLLRKQKYWLHQNISHLLVLELLWLIRFSSKVGKLNKFSMHSSPLRDMTKYSIKVRRDVKRELWWKHVLLRHRGVVASQCLPSLTALFVNVIIFTNGVTDYTTTVHVNSLLQTTVHRTIWFPISIICVFFYHHHRCQDCQYMHWFLTCLIHKCDKY